MDQKILELLEHIVAELAELRRRLDKNTTDLSDFSDRFEEVMLQLENERRLDFFANN